MRRHRRPHRIALTMLFAALVFFVLVVTMVIVGSVMFLLVQTGILGEVGAPNTLLVMSVFAVVSILIGTVVAALFGRVPLRPVNRLINGMNRLASGDFDVRLEIESHPAGREISESFNTLAGELRNTEMLRTDFVNNFSHEFKTPIVSIRGFAKLLQRGKLTEAQRQEYLGIIVDESTRLSEMATHVLNLTKVENQSILTDITCFNLSEQMRGCILLLEKKWTRKRLSIVAEFDEFSIEASDELLKQVWINLIDNAVKFSLEGGEVGVSILQDADSITVTVTNNGSEISDADAKRIFDKFWQGDSSHSTEGTGIGLSIAKRIVTLHGGTIQVASRPEETAFCVTLPRGQTGLG